MENERKMQKTRNPFSKKLRAKREKKLRELQELAVGLLAICDRQWRAIDEAAGEYVAEYSIMPHDQRDRVEDGLELLDQGITALANALGVGEEVRARIARRATFHSLTGSRHVDLGNVQHVGDGEGEATSEEVESTTPAA